MRSAHAANWTLRDAERYLLSLELFGMRFGLERMRRLMTTLDSPQEQFDSIHVVGTNGKSSTTRMIAALLQRHGLRTGSYTSPHLTSFCERIQIAEQDVDGEALAAAVQRAARAAELVERNLGPDDRITQFEALTAAAYSELAASGVEVAVVEAGLGGRYDATSVIRSRIQVLTNVGLEHTRWLGPTIADIAREKLAVVPPSGTIVVPPQLHPEAEDALAETAADRGATIVRAGEDAGVELAAAGAFQRRNFALALAAARTYASDLRDDEVRAAATSTRVPGRFEVIAQDPLTVIDGAHNPGGLEALAETLPSFLGGRPLTAVVSILEDKDAVEMLRVLLPLCEGIVFCASSNPRALSPGTLESLTRQLGTDAEVTVEPDPRRALALARARAGSDGAVLATGSIYLIADLVRPAGAGPGATL